MTDAPAETERSQLMKRSRAALGADKFSNKVTQDAVKLCALCGTLNHRDNLECWTCRWHGEFSRDERTIALAWQRLASRYEEVRLEHITSQRMRSLGDFGAPRPLSRWQELMNGCRAWWRKFQTGRDLRMAQRQAALRSRIPSRPDQLGV